MSVRDGVHCAVHGTVVKVRPRATEMSQAAHKGHGNAGAVCLRAQEGEKARKEIFAATEREKQRMRDETAAYRLGARDQRFSSSVQSAEAALAQKRTVGLISKE